MPKPDLKTLEKREATIKSSLAAAGDGVDPDKRRAMRKRLRRTQRKRRLLARHLAKTAPATAPEGSEAKEAPASE